MRNNLVRGAFITAALGLMLEATGCRVDTHRNEGNKDVKIATPFGGMSVQTNGAAVQEGVGLAIYPGATLVKKEKDSGAADVNIGFGNFRLSIKALSYRTPDAPEKVLAFYRNDMTRYGAVIQCRNNYSVGAPDHTQDGLTCEKDHSAKFQVDNDNANLELKAGSKQKQHIVGIEPDGSGTKIGLVALELPIHLGSEAGEDKQ